MPCLMVRTEKDIRCQKGVKVNGKRGACAQQREGAACQRGVWCGAARSGVARADPPDVCLTPEVPATSCVFAT